MCKSVCVLLLNLKDLVWEEQGSYKEYNIDYSNLIHLELGNWISNVVFIYGRMAERTFGRILAEYWHDRMLDIY